MNALGWWAIGIAPDRPPKFRRGYVCRRRRTVRIYFPMLLLSRHEHRGRLLFGLPANVAAVALYPGLVRTEAVMRAAEYFDLSNSESPHFIGRGIAGLWRDRKHLEKSGKALVAAELAMEFGISDIDGYGPRPLTREDFGNRN